MFPRVNRWLLSEQADNIRIGSLGKLLNGIIAQFLLSLTPLHLVGFGFSPLHDLPFFKISIAWDSVSSSQQLWLFDR